MPPLLYSELSNAVIGAAIEVHKQLGPGYLESIYERAICLELETRGIAFKCQSEFTVLYNGQPVGKHRLDLLVEDKLVVELKATSKLDQAFYQTVRSYITALGESQGLLLNFGTGILQVKRVFANRPMDSTFSPVDSDDIE